MPNRDLDRKLIDHPLDYEPVDPRPDHALVDYRGNHSLEGERVTRKQFLFVQRLFDLDFDSQRAYLAAGFKGDPKAGSERLLSLPHINEAIMKRLRVTREQRTVTLEDVKARLWNEAQAEGEGTQHSARVSALGNLAKMLGGFDKENFEKKRKLVAVNFDFGS